MENPFAWLPKAGERKSIPGGIMFCSEWRVNQGPGGFCTGKIVFAFECSATEYEAAMSQRPALPAPTLALVDR